MVGSKLCYADSLLLPSTLFCFAALRSAPRLAFPIHVSSLIFRSKPWLSILVGAHPFRAVPSLPVSYRVASPPCRSYSYHRLTIPQPFASSRVHSLPSPVLSGRCHAIACQLISVCTVHGHSLARRIGSVLGCAVSYLLDVMLFRIKSSPLQSAPIRFSASLFSAKQGGSNPLPLVSGRFRLCSALPYQILESHLQSLPWLLFAFLAGPFRIRSDPCASAGLVSNSAHFGSCPSLAVSPPCSSLRVVSPQRRAVAYRVSTVRCHLTASLVAAELIRCHSTQVKSGLITSVANRGCARQSPVSSTPPAPISAVPVRFQSHQFHASPFHLYSSSILSKRRRAIAPRLCASRISAAHRRFGSQAFDARPFRFTSQ